MAGRTGGAGGTDDTVPPLPTSYEDARTELAAIVRALETGGQSLEESLALWERGEALAGLCGTWLQAARARLDAADPDRPPATHDAEQADPAVGPRNTGGGPT